MTRVREVGPPLAAWQYPAPELANLSAMPPWVAAIATTGRHFLFLEQEAGTDQLEPGDWCVLLDSGIVRHVRQDLFAETYEVLP